jgi:hypothetical protein
MTTLTVDIKNDMDLPVITEILSRFGASYKINKTSGSSKEEKLYNRLKKSFIEINDWETGKIQLQDAREAIKEIESELDNCL